MLAPFEDAIAAVLLVLGRPLRVLVVIVAQLGASLTAKLGQKLSVVVDYADAPVPLDQDVAMLQVAMGYTQPSKACSRATTPMRGYATVERYFPGCEFGALEAQVGFWTAWLNSVNPGHGMAFASPRAVPK